LQNLFHLDAGSYARLAVITAVAFSLTLISVPIARSIARRLNIVAPVDSESRHRSPIALLGGAPIVASIVVAPLLFSAIPPWMLIGAIGLFAIGLFDDVVALSPPRKLALQAIVVVGALAVWPVPVMAPWRLVNDAIVAFWMLSTINAFNLIDGLDGLAGGIGVCAALTITVLGVSRDDFVTAGAALAIAAALGGFLIFNAHPASIFMGDCGALPLGFLLGGLALVAGGHAAGSSRLMRYVIPVLVMLTPLLDMTIACISRAATGTPVTRRGLDHSHHRLLASGLSDRVAVGVCWCVAALSGTCAIAAAAIPRAYLIFAIPMIAAFFGLIACFMIDLTFDVEPPRLARNRLSGLARFIRNFGYERRFAEIALDLVLIAVAYLGAFILRLGLVINDVTVANLLPNVPLVLVISFMACSIAGLYRRVWRYTRPSDLVRVANAAVTSGILLIAASYFLPIMLSGSITILFVLLLFNLLFLSRASFIAFRNGIAALARFSSNGNASPMPIIRLSIEEDEKVAISEIPATNKVMV
jgi:UDP-GlcNAc:undecaprenyl-phosphate GlcNAc-1-phosphate transferase